MLRVQRTSFGCDLPLGFCFCVPQSDCWEVRISVETFSVGYVIISHFLSLLTSAFQGSVIIVWCIFIASQKELELQHCLKDMENWEPVIHDVSS